MNGRTWGLGVALCVVLVAAFAGEVAATCPARAEGQVIVLTGTNGLEVRLEATGVTVKGPLPATGEIAGEQVAFGPAAIGGGWWSVWASDALVHVVVTPKGAAHADLTLRRETVAGERSPIVPVPGVDLCDARAFAAAIAAARADAATVMDVRWADLFARPTDFHGRRIRLTHAVVAQRFESRFWMAASIPEGTWRMTAEGLFESQPGRGYGHLGMWAGRWSVSRVLARRPAGSTLVEQVSERVEAAAAKAFAAIRRETLGWEAAVSLPIPRPWPATGKPGALCFYLYGWGRSKAGDTHVGSAWGRACVAPDAWDAPVVIERLSDTLEDLGPATPYEANGLYEKAALSVIGLAVDGETQDLYPKVIAAAYDGWARTRGRLVAQLRRHEPTFWSWVSDHLPAPAPE